MEQKQFEQDDRDYYAEKDRIGDFIKTVILKKPHTNPLLLAQLLSPKYQNEDEESAGYVEKEVDVVSISDAPDVDQGEAESSMNLDQGTQSNQYEITGDMVMDASFSDGLSKKLND